MFAGGDLRAPDRDRRIKWGGRGNGGCATATGRQYGKGGKLLEVEGAGGYGKSGKRGPPGRDKIGKEGYNAGRNEAGKSD